jgi:hypothetical protein
MKSAFILAIIISLSCPAYSEIWKCQRQGAASASYTDSPTGEDGVECEKVEAIRFSKESDRGGGSVSPGRSYSSPPASAPHTITKVRAKVSAANTNRSRALKSMDDTRSSKGGRNRKSGLK